MSDTIKNKILTTGHSTVPSQRQKVQKYQSSFKIQFSIIFPVRINSFPYLLALVKYILIACLCSLLDFDLPEDVDLVLLRFLTSST
jgi:hypothetical protein